MEALISNIWSEIWGPINDTKLWELGRVDIWRDFWLREVFKYTSRVIYFLPLLPILMMLRGRALKIGIVATCVVFLGFNFGLLYPVFWLTMCLVFYRLTEQYAKEVQRTDVWKYGPTIASILLVVGVALVVGVLQMGWVTQLPYAARDAVQAHLTPFFADLHERFWWLYPYCFRGVWWEPSLIPADNPHPNLLSVMFIMPHMIGTAYFMVRMWCYFSDIRMGTLPKDQRSLLDFLAYTCYAPSLMQGPIERYGRFREEINACHARRSWRNVPWSAWRFFLGISKILVAHVYVIPFINDYMKAGPGYYVHPELIGNYWVLYFGVFAEITSLYLLFAGYCDIAAAMSRLIGYRLIENFDKPFLATSLRDFWRRWHISLSFILRDYIYIPLGGNRKHALFNVCVTFFICGIWHAPNPRYGFWGILMALLVAGNQIWHLWMKRVDETNEGFVALIRRNWLKLRPLPQICAWAVTMNVFVMSLLIFFGAEGGLLVLWELIRRPLNATLLAFGVDAQLPSLNTLAGRA